MLGSCSTRSCPACDHLSVVFPGRWSVPGMSYGHSDALRPGSPSPTGVRSQPVPVRVNEHDRVPRRRARCRTSTTTCWGPSGRRRVRVVVGSFEGEVQQIVRLRSPNSGHGACGTRPPARTRTGRSSSPPRRATRGTDPWIPASATCRNRGFSPGHRGLAGTGCVLRIFRRRPRPSSGRQCPLRRFRSSPSVPRASSPPRWTWCPAQEPNAFSGWGPRPWRPSITSVRHVLPSAPKFGSTNGTGPTPVRDARFRQAAPASGSTGSGPQPAAFGSAPRPSRRPVPPQCIMKSLPWAPVVVRGASSNPPASRDQPRAAISAAVRGQRPVSLLMPSCPC